MLQGGSPGANEYMGDGPYLRDEPGVAHNRGTVGISTRGRDTGDGQLFINLIDSPRLDHVYTVFAVVERGMDVADMVLEGDVMARVELVAAPAPVIMRSSRLPRDLTPNALAAALARARAEGRPVADLTLSNPTRAGLPYPLDLLAPLADPAGLSLRPRAVRTAHGADGRGGRLRAAGGGGGARSRVPHGEHERGLRPALQAAVRCRRPGARAATELSAVRAPDGPRVRAGRALSRSISTATGASTSTAIERHLDERTRAVLVVSPNNPTGSVVQPGELELLAELCAARGVALIGDEVFADYQLAGAPPAPSVLQQIARPRVRAGRAVEVGGPAAGEGGVDWR